MASAPLAPSTAHASFFLGHVPLELHGREFWERQSHTTQSTRLLTMKSPHFTTVTGITRTFNPLTPDHSVAHRWPT